MMTKLVITNSGTEEEARDVYRMPSWCFGRKRGPETCAHVEDEHLHLQHLSNLWRKELDRKKRLSNEEKDSAESMTWTAPNAEKNHCAVPGAVG